MATILIDFDGTCVPGLPEPGFSEVDTGAERVLKKLVKAGHMLVLWTVRNSSRNNPYNWTNGKFRQETSLGEAERWFKERNIPLFGINQVPGEEETVGYSRKALADFMIDDTAIGTPITFGQVTYYSYSKESMETCNTHCVDWVILDEILDKEGFYKPVKSL